jgi:hypothetical protein
MSSPEVDERPSSGRDQPERKHLSAYSRANLVVVPRETVSKALTSA